VNAGARPGDVVLSLAAADSVEAQAAVGHYFAELTERFPDGFDDVPIAADAAAYTPPSGAFVVASIDGEVVGCGAVRLLDVATAEIKRMWVDRQRRGHGVGGLLLRRLEAEAVALGAGRVVLDTNETLTEAIAMYARAGYAPTERYNENPYATNWFAKPLT